MHITELNPTFVQRGKNGHRSVLDIKDADGIEFACPKCSRQKGTLDVHRILCWFARRVNNETTPESHGWIPQGQNLETFSMQGSIQLNYGCGWHGFIYSSGVVDA